MEPIIEIKNLTKDYETGFWRKKKVRALDDLTLSVEGGQIFGFLGGNGAGKTTTIKILMSLLFATSGSAKILGHDISEVNMHQSIGYCPENPYFYDYLTAFELMNYFGEIFGVNGPRRKEKAAELLTKVGLEEKDWNKQLRKFSKGMLQRVGLAQSLINDPTVVFLDEPMSGLDPMGRREIRELIAGLRANGTTVFMSTHILSDVAILRGGKLAATGRLDDLLTRHEEQRPFEVVVSGVSAEHLRIEMENVGADSITSNANGSIVRVPDEKHIERILQITRDSGGKLVSVSAVKQSLEELFVKESADD